MRKLKRYIFIIAVSVVIGLGLGILLSLLGMETSFRAKETSLVILVLSAIFALPLHTLIHEGGHGICGGLSGFSFVYFRLFDLQIGRGEKGWSLSQVHIPGTLGQCVMEPKKSWEETSFTAYLLGGGLFNLLSCLVFLYLGLEAKDGGLWEIYFGLALSGIFLGISNLMPLEIGGIATDGKNLALIAQGDRAKIAIWSQLKITGQLSKGKTWEDLDPAYIIDLGGYYGENFLQRQLGLLNASYWMGRNQVFRGERILEEIRQSSHLKGLEATIYFFVKLELLRRKEEWAAYRTLYQEVEDQIRPLGQTEDGLYSRYIYERYVLDDRDRAEKTWGKFLEKAKTSSYQGVIDLIIEEERIRQGV